MVYLFVGEDEISKKRKIEAIKKENFKAGFDNFNYQVLFSKDLKLPQLQEYLLKYPFKEKQSILIIKEIESLDEENKKFLLDYILINHPDLILILDIYQLDSKNSFINALTNNNQVKIFSFKRSFYPSVFSLARLVSQKKTQDALLVLNELVNQKTRPEKIIGGLRYQWEKEDLSSKEKIRRFNILLEADSNIKTGVLNPELALEVLLMKLCN